MPPLQKKGDQPTVGVVKITDLSQPKGMASGVPWSVPAWVCDANVQCAPPSVVRQNATSSDPDAAPISDAPAMNDVEKLNAA